MEFSRTVCDCGGLGWIPSSVGETVKLPQGVTTQTLQTYRGIAENAIRAGKDTLGVQAARAEAIDLLLKVGQ